MARGDAGVPGLARARDLTRHGSARRTARDRGVATARRRRDVHVVGWPPLRALRRRGARRLAARRHAP